MQNYSYENDFDLYENSTARRTHFCTSTRFETEAQENLEMAYCPDNCSHYYSNVFVSKRRGEIKRKTKPAEDVLHSIHSLSPRSALFTCALTKQHE